MADVEDDLGSMPTNPAPARIIPVAVGILPGRVLAGRYEILAKLGHGGMGAVFRAHDRELGEDVALKVILPERIRDVGVLDRFRREVKLARKIAHPNVCRVFDVGEEGNVRFLTMEFIEGKSLRELIAKGVLEPSRALAILHQIIQGMAAVHGQGIVHRDLKPDNIMVREGGQAVVADFGLARTPNGDAAESNFAGTPAYMSPEQLRGGVLDGRSDIFALGIVAYEMLTGRLPFTGQTIAEIATATLRDPPASFQIPGLSESMQRGVKVGILRALEKKPADRFASMVEFNDALISAGVDHSAPTMTSSTARVTIPALPRRISALAVAAGALVVLGIGAYSWRIKAFAISTPQEPAAVASVASSASSPASSTKNPQAMQFYRQARALLHDGDIEAATMTMKRAVDIEPTFAAAHVQLALWSGESDPIEGNKHYQKAVQYSAELDARDLDILQATEPWLRVPWDLEELERRFESLTHRYPDDWEILGTLAAVEAHRWKLDAAIDTANRALEVDVTAVPPWNVKAYAMGLKGDTRGQREAFDRCLEMSPRALKCLDGRINSAARFGDCQRVKDDATRRLLIQPDTASTYRTLATALETTAATRNTVLEALDKSYAFEPRERRTIAELSARGALAVRDGDFVAATHIFEQWQQQVAKSDAQTTQAEPALLLARTHREMGSVKDAGRIANGFLERERMWIHSPYSDPTVEFLSIADNAQMVSHDEFERRREEWMTSFRKRWLDSGQKPGLLLDWWVWAFGHGTIVETRDDAVRALEQMPKERLSNMNADLYAFDAIEGKVYALAGEFDKSIELLRRAAENCNVLVDPITPLHARFYLGLALHGKGDEAGAREAFQYVVDRWGKAKPRSVTAENAQKALEKLDERDKRVAKSSTKPTNPFGTAIDTRR